MKDDAATPIAGMAGAFAVVCCAGPLLTAAIGTAALTSWLTNSAYVLVPSVLIALGLGAFWYYRRRTSVQGCCRTIGDNKALQHRE